MSSLPVTKAEKVDIGVERDETDQSTRVTGNHVHMITDRFGQRRDV